MRKKIYFRADAGADIGYGHFIRTLALADMLKEDFDCTFFTVNPTSYQIVEMEKVCNYITLQSNTRFNDFLSFLIGDEIVVLDNYFFTTDYQQQIKTKGCGLVCIDDMHDKHYVADIVINHGVTNKELFSKEPYTQLCLGYDWGLLRKPFLQLPQLPHSNKKIEKAIVCFGASDSNHLAERFVCFLQKELTIKQIVVIVGDKSQTNKWKNNSNVIYLRNLSADEMTDLFLKADIAFMPTSTVCLEALSQQLPVAAGYYVANQKGMYDELVTNHLIFPLGNLLELDQLDYSLIEKNIGSLECVDFSFVPLRHQILFQNRFVPKQIKKNGLTFIDYRILDEHQHSLILHVRNEDCIRSQMEHSELISWESHLSFVSKLVSQYKKIYMAIYREDKLIGSVNIEYSSVTQVERGIFILPDLWGKGDAVLIEETLFEILREQKIDTVAAKVLRSNFRSLHFHLKLGYKLISNDDKYDYLVKKIN